MDENTITTNKTGLTVRYGEDIGSKLPDDFLSTVFELDKVVYGDHPEYIGCLENLVDRYSAFRQSFVFLMDGTELAAYICFFPVKESMWKRIVDPGEDDIRWSESIVDGKAVRLEQIPDDDILGKDIVSEPSADEPMRLFVISAAVAPAYRKTDGDGLRVSDILMMEWIKYLNIIREQTGADIESIAAVVVSKGGSTFSRSAAFRIERICMDSVEEDDRSRVVLCDGKRLERFLKGEFYRKTFKDDIYIMLPFETDENDTRLENLPEAYGSMDQEEDEKLPHYARYMMRQLKNSRDFECSNAVSREVTEHYLGRFRFLHTLDDYCDEEDPEEAPTIIGEEDADLILLAHRRTGMYIVLILIPNSVYSTSQIFDQCSKDYIKIRDPKWNEDEAGCRLSRGAYRYAHINDLLEERYGLISAGNGKCMTCMTKVPVPQPGESAVEVGDGRKTTREMMNILAGETYYSLFQDFRIYNRDLMDIATTDLAAYDYYSSYMSERTIVFILKDEVIKKMPPDSDYLDEYSTEEDPVEEGGEEYLVLTRIGLATTMLFIMEMVMFQNTSLAKMTDRVSKALAQAGNVPWEYINRIYEDYGKTIQFWKTDNFKYYGTECEARHIREAFENDDLKNIYNEQRQYLQDVVDLNGAELERRNSKFIGIIGIVFAVFQVKDYVIDLITNFYASLPDYWIADAEVEANRTFNVLGIGGFILAFFLLHMTSRRSFYNKMRRLIRSDEKRSEDGKGSADERQKNKT